MLHASEQTTSIQMRDELKSDNDQTKPIEMQDELKCDSDQTKSIKMQDGQKCDSANAIHSNAKCIEIRL